jgi:hypothetical protein
MQYDLKLAKTYDLKCRVTQYYKCQRYDHIETVYYNQQKYGHYRDNHRTDKYAEKK